MNFLSFFLKNKFPNKETREQLFEGPFTFARGLFYGLCTAFLVIIYVLIIRANDTMLVTVPAKGGTIREGVIGAPRFINPILAATDTDVALTHLVYSGLMKENGDGSIVPDLARAYNISPDNRTYTFTLYDKLFFHDGTPLTSSDIAFTIEKLQNTTLNPRLASYWQGVSVATPNKNTVAITLMSPDSTLLKKMTVGILSTAEWQGVPDVGFTDPSLNLSPVGAGPFKLTGISYDSSNAPKKIIFTRNRQYPSGAPLLKTLEVSVFANQDAVLSALKDGTIDMSISVDASALTSDILPEATTTFPIPTEASMTLYRLSNEPILGNTTLLATLNQYVDKGAILAKVENGYGIPEDNVSPVSLEEAHTTLAKLGYTLNDGVLSKGGTAVTISIATLNDPVLLDTSRALSNQFSALGIVSSVKVFDVGTFQDELHALLFPFVLMNTSTETVPSAYVSAIPLYTTAIVLTANTSVHVVPQSILHQNDLRYSNVSKWHENTDRVWKWLIKNNSIQ